MLVIAAIEEYCFLRRTVTPVRRWVVQRGVTRPGCLEPGRDYDRIGLVGWVGGGGCGVDEGEGQTVAPGRDGMGEEGG